MKYRKVEDLLEALQLGIVSRNSIMTSARRYAAQENIEKEDFYRKAVRLYDAWVIQESKNENC